jgi:hypothetical protein
MSIGDRTVAVPLLQGEEVVAEAFGAVGHKAGGKLIVTNRRLIFQPWDLGLSATLVKWGSKAVGAPHAGALNYVVGRLVGTVDATAQGVGGITRVEPVGQASLLKLPQIRVTKDDGTSAEFGVVDSPTTPNFSSKNNSARDRLVTVVKQNLL